MNRCQSLFGTKLFSLVTRPTFYDQFVGGDTKEELQWTVDGLNKANVRLMVCPVQEEDLDTIQGKYDDNLDYIKNAAGIMASCDTTEPNLQFKVTAFMPATIVVSITNKIEIFNLNARAIEKQFTIWTLLENLDIFGLFWTFLDNLDNLDIFRQVGHFGHIWKFFENLDIFDIF